MLDEAQRAELVERELRRTYDEAGAILREKPPRSVRIMARLARKRARAGLDALARADLFMASSIFGWAKDAMALTAERRKHVQLWPDAERWRRFNNGCRKDRSDALARLIDAALDAHPDASAKELLRTMQELDSGRKPVIQEITDDGTIH